MARLELDKTRVMHEERRKTLSEETKHANQVKILTYTINIGIFRLSLKIIPSGKLLFARIIPVLTTN